MRCSGAKSGIRRDVDRLSSKRRRRRRRPLFNAERGRPQKILPDFENVKHAEFGFDSLVRVPLWDAAGWTGVGWTWHTSRRPTQPPCMVLIFKNRTAADAIFKHLVEDVGQDDPADRLRVTVVKGIRRSNPAHYRVIIGSNVTAATLKKVGLMISRVQEMTPDSSDNFDRFFATYQEVGAFVVAGGVVPASPRDPMPSVRTGHVLKRQLIVRDAWEIGLNDQDVPAIHSDDDVIIPAEHLNDAPVLRLIEWKQKPDRMR